LADLQRTVYPHSGTRQLQAERRTGSVRRPKTGVLPTVLRKCGQPRLRHWDSSPQWRSKTTSGIYTDVVRPDSSTKRVRLLRDTGALQSLICSRILTDADYVSTGEFRLIRGVTGDIVSVPVVEVTLTSTMCCGTFLCGVVSTLPSGIAILVGNDICSDDPVTDVSVVTR